MSSRFSVIKYWCSTAPAGTDTPANFATSRAQIPAALTTISHAISPLSVRTLVMRRSFVPKPVTRMPSMNFTPPFLAPRA